MSSRFHSLGGDGVGVRVGVAVGTDVDVMVGVGVVPSADAHAAAMSKTAERANNEIKNLINFLLVQDGYTIDFSLRQL